MLWGEEKESTKQFESNGSCLEFGPLSYDHEAATSQLSMVKIGTSVQPKRWLGMDGGVGRTRLSRRQDGLARRLCTGVVIVCAHPVDGTLAFSLDWSTSL